MRTFGSGASRFAWCRSQAKWTMAAISARLEDMDGAIEAGQGGLVRYSAVAVGEDCAVMLALVLCNEKPLPKRNMRATWALERIRGHELRPECLALIRCFGSQASDKQIRDRSHRLVELTRAIVGEVPDALTNEGYFPALKLARDWYTILGALGEEGFFPEEWSRRAEAPASDAAAPAATE